MKHFLILGLIATGLVSCNTARSLGNTAAGAVRGTANTIGNVGSGAVNATRNAGGAVMDDVRSVTGQ